jgi:hypothetical protein
MRTGKTEQAQVRAAEALLDRGWGRPAQQVGGSEDGGPIQIYLKNFTLPAEDGGEAVETGDPPVRIR